MRCRGKLYLDTVATSFWAKISSQDLTVLLSHCQTVLLSYCLTVILSYCHTVILSYCLTVLLSYCNTVILSRCLTVILSYCHTVLLSYCLIHHYTITSFNYHMHYIKHYIIWILSTCAYSRADWPLSGVHCFVAGPTGKLTPL